MEPSAPLASNMGMEHHHPILIALISHVGNIDREREGNICLNVFRFLGELKKKVGNTPQVPLN